jgi:hypothetical protein
VTSRGTVLSVGGHGEAALDQREQLDQGVVPATGLYEILPHGICSKNVY